MTSGQKHVSTGCRKPEKKLGKNSCSPWNTATSVFERQRYPGPRVDGLLQIRSSIAFSRGVTPVVSLRTRYDCRTPAPSVLHTSEPSVELTMLRPGVRVSKSSAPRTAYRLVTLSQLSLHVRFAGTEKSAKARRHGFAGTEAGQLCPLSSLVPVWIREPSSNPLNTIGTVLGHSCTVNADEKELHEQGGRVHPPPKFPIIIPQASIHQTITNHFHCAVIGVLVIARRSNPKF